MEQERKAAEKSSELQYRAQKELVKKSKVEASAEEMERLKDFISWNKINWAKPISTYESYVMKFSPNNPIKATWFLESTPDGVNKPVTKTLINFGFINKLFGNTGRGAKLKITIGKLITKKEWVRYGTVHNSKTDPDGFKVDEELGPNERVHYKGSGNYQSHTGGVGSGGGLRGTEKSHAYYHLNIPKGSDRTWQYYKMIRKEETIWKPYKIRIWWDYGTY